VTSHIRDLSTSLPVADTELVDATEEDAKEEDAKEEAIQPTS
jgi:hypothetical protein